MAKCRKKPIVLECMQVPLPPANAVGFLEWGTFGSWMGPGGPWRLTEGVGSEVEIETLEGKMRAKPGDYVIKGTEGEMWPVRRDIFEKTYDVLT